MWNIRMKIGSKFKLRFKFCQIALWVKFELIFKLRQIALIHTTKEINEKSVAFFFFKLKAMKKANFFKIIGGRRLFCGECRSLFAKLMFTHSAHSLI